MRENTNTFDRKQYIFFEKQYVYQFIFKVSYLKKDGFKMALRKLSWGIKLALIYETTVFINIYSLSF